MLRNEPGTSSPGSSGSAKSKCTVSLSIRDRIQAMNRTMDLVEEKHRSSTPKPDLLLRFSSSEDTFPSSSTDVNPVSNCFADQRPFPNSRAGGERSSVIDIWRSRENASPKFEVPKPTQKNSSGTASPKLKGRATGSEEKKEPELSNDSNQPKNARDVWTQRISQNRTVPETFESAPAIASKRRVRNDEVVSDFTIRQAKEPVQVEPRCSRISEHLTWHSKKPHNDLSSNGSAKQELRGFRRSPPLPPKLNVSDKLLRSSPGNGSPDPSAAVEYNVKPKRVTDIWEKRLRQKDGLDEEFTPVPLFREDKPPSVAQQTPSQAMLPPGCETLSSGVPMQDDLVQKLVRPLSRQSETKPVQEVLDKTIEPSMKQESILPSLRGHVVDVWQQKAKMTPTVLTNTRRSSCSGIDASKNTSTQLHDSTQPPVIPVPQSHVSLAERWTSKVNGVTMPASESILDSDDDNADFASVHTRGSTATLGSSGHRWNRRIKEVSSNRPSVSSQHETPWEAREESEPSQSRESLLSNTNDNEPTTGSCPSPSTSYRTVAEKWIKVAGDATTVQSAWSSKGKSTSKDVTRLSPGRNIVTDKRVTVKSDVQARIRSLEPPSVRLKHNSFRLKNCSMNVPERAVATAHTTTATPDDSMVSAPICCEAPHAQIAIGSANADAADVEVHAGIEVHCAPSKQHSQIEREVKDKETNDLPSSTISLQEISSSSDGADRRSDEPSHTPTKIIQSWNDRVFQTETVPSSPRFSRNVVKCDTSSSFPSESPKASPGAVCSSQSSAFNAWSGPQSPATVASPRKSDKASKNRNSRDFVSLGRKHIVQGFAPRERVETEHDKLACSEPSAVNGTDLAAASPVDVDKKTTDAISKSFLVDDSTCLSQCSPTAAKPTSTSRGDLEKVNRVTSAVNGNDLTAPKKPPTTRLHLPSPMIRRKKKNPLKPLPSVTPNLSDIVEVHSEDTNGSEPLSPRSRDVTSKKKGLQAHRRKLKSGSYDDGKVSASEEPKHFNETPTFKTASNSVTLDELVQAINQRNPPSVPGSIHAPAEELANIRAPQNAEHALTCQFHASSNPAPASLPQEDTVEATAARPRSPQASEAEFSFLSDSNSVQSGMTSILSGGSLTNRAEKVLTERRRMQRESSTLPSTRETLQSKSNNSPPNVKLPTKTVIKPSVQQQVEPSSSLRSSDRSSESGSNFQSLDRPRLETRYNKASRFLDSTQAHSNQESENQEPVLQPQGSAEPSCAVESTESSYQSAESATDESDSKARRPVKSRRAKKMSSKTRKNDRKPCSPSPGVASDKFLAEHAAHFDAFKSAAKHFSFRDIASDWAGEMKMLGFDTQNFATSVNNKIALCVNETKKAKSCHELMGFDEEDVAIEVEFMEEDLDLDDSNSLEEDDSTLEDELMESRPGNMGMICSPLGVQAERAQM